MSERLKLLLGLGVFLAVVSGTVATAVVFGGGPPSAAATNHSTNGAPSQPPAQSVQRLNISASGSSVYTNLYDQTIQSVVTIRVTTARGTAEGSGFVYDTNGHIVTNHHVIEGAQRVMVRFSDGSWHNASVIGSDVYTDLAVIEVQDVPADARPLPVARTNPVQGQRVAALGSPFDLEGSITSGIVSGVNRSMRTSRGFSIPATVQTDAPINPGNSGGPLLSLNGTVVGLNRAKSGDNIGFAISPLLVRRVVPDLIADGSYQHTYMGIRTVPVTPTVADANDLDRARGVMVVGVVSGGPSEGQLQASSSKARVGSQLVPTGGDVILSVDGTPIRSQQQLARTLMLNTRPGDTVSVTVLRDGQHKTVDVTLGQRPAPR